MAAKVLVVDDEPEIRSVLANRLEHGGFEVITACDGDEALERVKVERPAAVLMDLAMPRVGGLEALPVMRRLAPDTPVIICTGATDLPTAVEAMRLGAYDYVTKPFDFELVFLCAQRAVEHHDLRVRVDTLERESEGAPLAERMGQSAPIRQVIEQVGHVARSRYTVLILGETG